MRKIFNKVAAGAMTAVMVASMAVGVSFATAPVKAEGTDVSSAITPWVVYSAGQIYRSVDRDGWPERYYNAFTTTAGETKTDWNAKFLNQQYVDSGEETWHTTKKADGFTANIANTGWDGNYDEAGNLLGDNPYMLRADMPSIQLEEGHFYSISMNLKWTNAKNAPEKNVQISVNDGNTNNLDSQKVTITSGQTVKYETQRYEDGTSKVATYATDKLEIVIAMGAFLDSYNKGITTENVAAKGVLEVTDLRITDEGLDPNYEAPPEKATTPEVTTKAPEATTKASEVTTKAPESTTKATVKKLAKVKKVKAKNNKKKALTITWKKVKNAKKYQVKVGKKTYNTNKTKLVVKKLKKGKKYVVKVRAKATGYKAGAWSKAKKVKIKK